MVRMQSNNNILFRNFDVFSHSEKSLNNFKSLIFQLAVEGKLDFQKLSEGCIKKPLQALIKEQKQHLKKQGIPFEEQPDSVWPMTKLGDVCKLFKGVTYSKKDELENNGKVILRANNIDTNNKLNLREIKQINKEDIKENQRLKKNDIFICLASGSKKHIGKVAFIECNMDCYCGGFMGCLRGNKGIVSKYLFYTLCSQKFNSYLFEQIRNTTVNNLSKRILYNYQIPLPPLEVQKEIVALMEKVAQLETQTKEKSQKQKEFSKSSMQFITQSKNKKETAHHWEMLKNNFKDALYSENGAKQFKSMAFQLCLKGKLDFQKLSEDRIKKSLQTLVKEQKQHLKKQGIPFEEQPDSVWPMLELGETLKKIKYTNKIKKSNFLKEGTFPIIDQSENFIAGYWNNQEDVFKVNSPIIIFGDHTCCFKYIDFDFVLGADGVKIIQPKKQFSPLFLYYLLLNTKITNLGYSRHFKSLKKIKILLPSLEVQKEIVAFIKQIENIEKQIQKEKNLSLQLSQSLSHYS